MNEVTDTGCTFRGLRVFLEGAGEGMVSAFRRFSRKLSEDRLPASDLKQDTDAPIAAPVPLGHKEGSE